MAAVSLTTLRARARERADMTNSQFVTDTANSLDALLNEGAQTLHALLAEKFGQHYMVSSQAYSTVANTTTYALPTDMFKFLGLDMLINGQMVDIDAMMFKERNAFRTATPRGYSAMLPRYTLLGGNFMLYPVPNAVYSITLWYVPQLQVTHSSSITNLLVDATDTVNFDNGWEKYIVLHAAKAMLDKEETNSDRLAAELQQVEAHIEAEAEFRDMANPRQIVDVEAAVIDPRRIR